MEFYAFNYCQSLESIVLPDSLDEIKSSPYNCPYLSIFCPLSEDDIYFGDLDSNIPIYYFNQWHYDIDGNPVPNN